MIKMKTNQILGVLAASAVLFGMVSCQRIDEIANRLELVESVVSDLQSSVSALQDAISQGKVIKAVLPLHDDENGGWLVVFSDDTSIRLINGKSGITPFLKVDQNGCWTVSYDDGSIFNKLTDNEGNPIMAVGQDGSDGLSIRLVINDAGYYVVQSYYQSAPEMVVNEISTPYTADANRLISSITQDDKTHVITMTLADGSKYSFNMLCVSPTSIAILSVNPVFLSFGTQASIEFRVNPSNALFTLSGDDCQIELDKVGTMQPRSSYVKTPSNYKLIRVEQVYDGNTDEMKVGQYRAVIEDTQQSAEYDEMAALVMNIEDANGDEVQISSSAFEIKGGFDEKLKTGLPIVVINTPNSDPIKSKEEWMAGATMTIINPDMSIDYQGSLSIKGRGNSTWWIYDKKPYTLKLDKKAEILEMPKDKRWDLLANAPDPTNLRNALGFYLASQTNTLGWTPKGKHVELILNGTHCGLYYLCEHIKISENRVNIKEMKSTDIEGDDITGGYLMEFDTQYDEANKFKTSLLGIPVMFKEPDEDVLVEPQFEYMQNYINNIEAALLANPIDMSYKNMIDIESFAEYFLLKEVCFNTETSLPRSVYMYKDRNDVLKIGPVWDFDLDPFYLKWKSFNNRHGIWFEYLFKDPEFKQLVINKWEVLKPKFLTVFDYISNYRNQIKLSADRDNLMWPVKESYQYFNVDYNMGYDDAVDFIYNGLNERISWIDSNIQGL